MDSFGNSDEEAVPADSSFGNSAGGPAEKAPPEPEDAGRQFVRHFAAGRHNGAQAPAGPGGNS